MKLYGRTLLFFLGAISFQALLTSGLILGLVSRNNESITRVELHEESILVYENYIDWVRQMWTSAIGLRDEPELLSLAFEPGTWEENSRLTNLVADSLQGSGVDSFIIRKDGWDHFEILSDAYPFIDDFVPFDMDRDHPYIALKIVENHTFMVASLSLGDTTEIYLLKHIDDDFYNQLTTRDHSRVFVSSDSASMWESIGDGQDYSDVLGLDEPFPPYREMYDLNFGKGHYNVSVQNLGHLEGDGELRLIVFMSVELYFSILVQIGRIVLVVSIVTAGLTAAMALFSSRRLTRPVQELALATRVVREGNLDIVVPADASGDIKELVEDFNSMVHHLRENKITLDENLKEITFLKEYNETIVHSLMAGILVVDENLLIEKSNSFFRECFPDSQGKPEERILGEAGPFFLDREIQEATRNVARGESAAWTGIRRDGERVWNVKIYPLGSGIAAGGRAVVELDDVSAKTDLEQKILQAEKLSSLSLLSAGIAHEINNPLSTILSNAQMLMAREPEGPGKESLEWIERETRRIAEIVRDLRDFSHEDDNERTSNDLNDCVEEVVRLVRYGVSTDSRINIEFIPFPEPINISVPRDELRQAILNILQNGVHALDGDGDIHIQTLKIDERSLGIVISDTGSGIPEDILGRIFDPFFTTKTGGVGTGLGLSIVYGIVRKFGGDIDVKSTVGKGSVFTLTFPRGENLP